MLTSSDCLEVRLGTIGINSCTDIRCVHSSSCSIARFGNQEAIEREEGTLGSSALGWNEQGAGNRTGFTFQACHSVVKWPESVPSLSLVTFHIHTALRIIPIFVPGPSAYRYFCFNVSCVFSDILRKHDLKVTSKRKIESGIDYSKAIWFGNQKTWRKYCKNKQTNK